ncbi:MAG: hypothetical protein IPN34_25210 [Planctomycetes bacterium]|nr:hypothetical protein [Planctomycetota bacterium]
MPSPSEDPRPSTTPIFVAIVGLFLAGFGGFLYWSISQRQAAQARAAAIAQEVEAQRRATEAAKRAPTAPRASEAAVPQVPPLASSTPPAGARRKPTVRELPNGDREVTLLDGLVVLQPFAELHRFHLYAEGERNELGHPSGVLPDGSDVHENMPVTVDQRGKKVEILTRVRSTKLAGEVIETPDGPVLPKKN